jgi:hypothetical protein
VYIQPRRAVEGSEMKKNIETVGDVQDALSEFHGGRDLSHAEKNMVFLLTMGRSYPFVLDHAQKDLQAFLKECIEHQVAQKKKDLEMLEKVEKDMNTRAEKSAPISDDHEVEVEVEHHD